jgi:transcription elongation factor Elf1
LSQNIVHNLPLECPQCRHEGCTLVAKSITVLTCTCAKCRHTWATDMASLRADIQKRIDKILNDRESLL